MRLLLILFSAWLFAGNASALEPQHDVGVHDPTLLIQGERWFVFSTGSGLQRLESTDQGKTWRRLAPVFSQAAAWWAEAVPGHKALDVWAPKLFEHRGRVWVLYAISTFGKNRSAIGLASADTPAGDWRDEGRVVQSREEDDFNAIDPDLLAEPDGRLWLSYGSFWGGLRLTELNAETLRPTGAPAFIARRPGGIEAPTLHRRGDWVYLFASYGQCCKGAGSSYHVRVGRARSVTGPYLDRDGRDLMDAGGTLLLASGARWKGPGHQDVAGDWLVHHAYDSQRSGQPRLRVKRLAWTDYGWPLLTPED